MTTEERIEQQRAILQTDLMKKAMDDVFAAVLRTTALADDPQMGAYIACGAATGLFKLSISMLAQATHSTKEEHAMLKGCQALILTGMSTTESIRGMALLTGQRAKWEDGDDPMRGTRPGEYLLIQELANAHG